VKGTFDVVALVVLLVIVLVNVLDKVLVKVADLYASVTAVEDNVVKV
jgi:hypothetical protein